MKNTLNYNLKLPEYADIADIADLNYNAETIDAELINLKDEIDTNKMDILYINNNKQFITQENITEGFDINNLTTPGFYNIPAHVAPTLLNFPFTLQTPHSVVVLKKDNYTEQIVYTYNNRVVRRYSYWDGGVVWQGWSTMWDDNSCPISKSLNGWCRFANGLIVQWGLGGAYKVTDGNVNFPITFSAQSRIIATPTGESRSVGYYMPSIAIESNNNGFWFNVENRSRISLVPWDEVTNFTWIAIGY